MNDDKLYKALMKEEYVSIIRLVNAHLTKRDLVHSLFAFIPLEGRKQLYKAFVTDQLPTPQAAEHVAPDWEREGCPESVIADQKAERGF